ncbi:hypothetical protein D3C77_400900 [compost metagenome]
MACAVVPNATVLSAVALTEVPKASELVPLAVVLPVPMAMAPLLVANAFEPMAIIPVSKGSYTGVPAVTLEPSATEKSLLLMALKPAAND